MMIQSESKHSPQKLDALSISLGLGIMAMSFAISFHSGLKYQIREALQLNQRVVLSTISGSVTPDGLPLKIVKVKADNKIYIEIYNTQDQEQRLLSKLAIPDSHDAYLNVKGDTSNLMLNDIDGDKVAEIIVPSFDSDLIARLNIFKFDSMSNTFYLLTSKEN